MDHADLLRQALAYEAAAQRALLRGDAARSRELFGAAAQRYRASWEAAPPRSYGRLVGMLKASILAGEGGHDAVYVREALGDACDSPASCYALAVAALAQGDDAAALRAVKGMREGGDSFTRAADAIAALARGEGTAYAAAVQAIVDDFASRETHLTGVAIADTAVMLERCAPYFVTARGARGSVAVLRSSPFRECAPLHAPS